VVAVVLAVRLGWSFQKALDAFVVSNCVIGVSFGLCGALLAWHRPRHPIGWMYAVGGSLQTTTALAAPLAVVLHDHGAPAWLVRLDLTAFSWAWPWHIGVVLPLSLMLFPDGRLPSPRWRPWVLLAAVTSPLFVLGVGTSPQSFEGLRETAYFVLPGYDRLQALWTISEVRWTASMLLGLACLVTRYRRGDEVQRRQLLWLLSAAALVLVTVTPWALVAGTPIAVLFAIPLIPVAIAVAVLRHQLLDIRLVLARGLGYALLSGLVLAAYALLVVVLSGVASALIVALAALPLRARLQRAVDELMYGERGDPLRVARRVGGRLGTGLDGTLEEVRTALRLPHVHVTVDGSVIASAGTAHGPEQVVELDDGADLVVGLRPGETRLAPADQRVLALLAGPLDVAVRATRLTVQLQASRERLVTAREEERRRLRRDLHDGLGPLLTGVALSADAAANLAGKLAGTAPSDVLALLDAVRNDSRTAIAEVRRIVDDLRPPALDELGLVAALEVRAAQTRSHSDGSALHAVVDAPALPPLPAAIEVAAYRIATEALTNVVRHSTASHVVVRLQCSDVLSVEVVDDGCPNGAWSPGVGIGAMHERAAELGGQCVVGPSPDGGSVRVSLPLVPA
jgi:signal transduction histidine kinase